MIKDRIIQLIEFKGIAKENFYKKIGVTSANFRGKAKESDVSSITIAKILSEIPDARPEWLLTGKGEMLKQSDIPMVPPDSNEKDSYIIELQKDKIKHLEKELQDQKREIEQLKKELSLATNSKVGSIRV